jgi:hypothetical protein
MVIKDKGIEHMQTIFRDAAVFAFGCSCATPEMNRGLMLFAGFIATAFAAVLGLIRYWGNDE